VLNAIEERTSLEEVKMFSYRPIRHSNIGKCRWVIPPHSASENKYHNAAQEADIGRPRLSPSKGCRSFVRLGFAFVVHEIWWDVVVEMSKPGPQVSSAFIKEMRDGRLTIVHIG
jgi:hypothetical protein